MKKICKVCGKEYYVKPYLYERSKYCSKYCQNHGQYNCIKKICPTCQNVFYVSNSRIKRIYCSDLCAKVSHANIKQRRLQTKLYNRLHRQNPTSKTLRKFMFSIKPKKCEICGYDEYDFCLDIHHIDKNCLNNDIENLKILCAICHRKLHKGIIDRYGNKI